MLRATIVHSLVCALLLVACGDDDDTTATTDTSPTPDTVTGDTSTTPDTVADTVADTSAPVLESASFKFVGFGAETLGQFWVAWTPPGATRAVELLTDDDGKITLDDIDWSMGTGFLVGARSGQVVRGVLMNKPTADNGFIADTDGNWLIFTGPRDVDDISITGTAVNMVDDSHFLNVYPDTLYSRGHDGNGPNFNMHVPVDTPFNWCAFETTPGPIAFRTIDQTIDQVACGDSPGSPDNFTMPLDFTASSVSTTSVSGSFPNFSDDDSRLDDEGGIGVIVWAHDTISGLLGFATQARFVASGDVEYTVEYATASWADTPMTSFRVATNEEFSQVNRQGLPEAGSQDISLLAPPTFLAPTSSAPYPADFGLVWTNPNPEALVNLILTQGADNEAIANFNLPIGMTEWTVPLMPRGIDAFRDLGEGQVGVRIGNCDWTTSFGNGGRGICQGFSAGQTAALAPPETITIEVNAFDPVAGSGVLGADVCAGESCGTTSLLPGDIGATLVVPRGGDFVADVDADGYFPARHSLSHADTYQQIGLAIFSETLLNEALSDAGVTAEAGKGHIFVGIGSGGGAGVTFSLSPSSGTGPVYTGESGRPDPSGTAIVNAEEQFALFFNVEPGDYTLSHTAPTAGSCEFNADRAPVDGMTHTTSVVADRISLAPAMGCSAN